MDNITLEIEMKFLALRFGSFRSQKLEDPTPCYSCFFIQGWVVHELPLAILQINGSKDNPWDAWVMELGKDVLNLLVIWWNHHQQENHQSFHQKPQISSWEENPKNESYFSWAHHEQDWGCWWCPWSGAGASFLSLLLLLQSPFQSFLSLVLGFVLVLGV